MRVKHVSRSMNLDMVPMVNIVFLLLMFFMLSGELREHDKDEEDLELPQTIRERPLLAASSEDVVKLSIDVRGFVRWDTGDFKPWQALQGRLKGLVNRDVMIFAEQQAPSGVLHALLVALQSVSGGDAPQTVLVVFGGGGGGGR